MSLLLRLASTILSAGLLASCTSQVPEIRSGDTDPRPTAPALPAHRIGNCYDLSVTDLDDATSAVPPTRCSRPHTATTVALLKVGESRSDVADRCARAVARHLGVSVAILHATMIEPVWFLAEPGTDERVRCDFVAFSRADELVSLPRRTHELLERSAVAESFRICGTAKPGAEGFERVSCANKHSWRVVAALDLGERAYPGEEALRKEGDESCSERARAEHGFALKFTYGWEWPTRDQWVAGQHYGLCWTTD